MFSTDTNPAKSKTKCLYMCGPKNKNPVYPAPLQLYGRDLPWVQHASHLGHELHQDCTMNIDVSMKRASYIKSSVDTREMFHFALPCQVLSAISVYSAHFYGAMLWDLYGEMAGQVYRSWNTTVKLVWNLPRGTHNYFVDQLLERHLQVGSSLSLEKLMNSSRLNVVRGNPVNIEKRITIGGECLKIWIL